MEFLVGTPTYHAPETPYAKLLACAAVTDEMKDRLRAVAVQLDPLHLLEEIRSVQHHLAALATDQTTHLVHRGLDVRGRDTLAADPGEAVIDPGAGQGGLSGDYLKKKHQWTSALAPSLRVAFPVVEDAFDFSNGRNELAGD